MSNEPKHPKYSCNTLLSVFYDGQKVITMNDACAELNRMDAEVERLKEELRITEFQDAHGAEVIRNLQSDLARCKSERLGAEEFRELINKRIAEFNAIHHTYEGVKLQEAMDVILRLVPPSAFCASQPTNPELK